MKYKMTKKAYWCGHRDDLHSPSPDSPCFTVEVDANMHKSEIEARYKYFRERFRDGYKFSEIRSKRQKHLDKYVIEGEEEFGDKYLSDILNRIKTEKWRKEMENFVRSNKNEKVFIWSGYNNAFWRPKGAGYTTNINDAGIYEIKDAWSRVSHVDATKQISFQLVD